MINAHLPVGARVAWMDNLGTTKHGTVVGPSHHLREKFGFDGIGVEFDGEAPMRTSFNDPTWLSVLDEDNWHVLDDPDEPIGPGFVVSALDYIDALDAVMLDLFARWTDDMRGYLSFAEYLRRSVAIDDYLDDPPAPWLTAPLVLAYFEEHEDDLNL